MTTATTTLQHPSSLLETDDDNEDEDSSVLQQQLQQDVRQLYHPIFSSFSSSSTLPPPTDEGATTTTAQTADARPTTTTASDMDVVFVGTASCTPGTTRGVSCTAVRLNWKRRTINVNHQHHDNESSHNNHPSSSQSSKPKMVVESIQGFQGGTWLFDVGECTQLQVQRTSSIRPSKITKIFLTHAHGDHTFGLPGMLCLMGQDRDTRRPSSAAGMGGSSSTAAAAGGGGASGPGQVVDIYGPEGLRMWLRVAIRYSCSRIVPPYRVHELMDVPMAPEWEFNPRMHRYFYRGRPAATRTTTTDAATASSNSNYRQQQQRSNNRFQKQEQQQQRHAGKWTPKGLAGEDPSSWISQASMFSFEPSPLYGEMDGGRNIYPIWDHPLSHDGAPVWEVEDEQDVKVYAAPMCHGIPCVGYVVQEMERPGRLRNEMVEPIVKRNVNALKQAGFTHPMKAMAVIKSLQPGSSFTFPDGTVVTQEEAVEAPRPGRKVVICGDTSDSRALIRLAQGADVVVHEATNSYLAGVDSKDATLRDVTRDAVLHGHSTPQIAGHFARVVNAKRLVLNHFSARYKGDTSVDSLSIMMRMERQAMHASGLNETQVAAAWDLMVLPLPHG